MIVDETKKPIPVGAGLKIHAECSCGHKTSWQSCELLNNGLTSAIDVLISTMQLSIGLNMSQVSKIPLSSQIKICVLSVLRIRIRIHEGKTYP